MIPLARLYAACPSAASVYLHLIQEAVRRKSPLVLTNRGAIARSTGIRKLDTISTALKALKGERLIKYRAPARFNSAGGTHGKYLKITLLKAPLKGVSENIASLWKTPLKGVSAAAPSLWRTPFKGALPTVVGVEHGSARPAPPRAGLPILEHTTVARPLTEMEAKALFHQQPCDRATKTETNIVGKPSSVDGATSSSSPAITAPLEKGERDE